MNPLQKNQYRRKLTIFLAAISFSLSACGNGANSNSSEEICGTDSNCALGFEAGKSYVNEIKSQGGEVVANAGETCLTIVSINGFTGNNLDKASWRIGCEKAIAAFK